MTYEEFLKKVFNLLKEDIELYSAYVEGIGKEGDDDDWFNLFAFRDEIAAIFYTSPIFPIAKEMKKEKTLRKLVYKLRKADLLLAERSDYLVRIFNFEEWRKTLPFTPSPFAWWYLIDRVNRGDITIPKEFPLSSSLFGLSVEGVVDNKKCQVLLIAPDIPIRVDRKHFGHFIRNFFAKFAENAVIDLPQIFIDNNNRTESLLLPTSTFWGKFKKLKFFNPYITDTYLALPKNNSKILNLFFEEFVEKIKTGDRKIFSQKVLTSEEFFFVPVMLIKKTTVKVTIAADFQTEFEDISKKYSYIPQEVAVAV